MAVVRRGATVVDIGPAAASGVDGLAAIGRLSAVKGSDSGSLEPDTGQAAGYGAIERRKATPEELARFDAPDPAPSAETRAGPAIHLLRSASHVQMNESRHRGGEVTRELRAQQRPAPRSAQGTASGPAGSATTAGRVVGTPARTEAPLPAPKEEEPMALEAAPPAAGDELTPPVDLCATCLHRPVCRIRDELELRPDVDELAPGVLIRAVWTIVECDHHLAADRVRQATPAEVRALRQPGHHGTHPAEEREKAERAMRALEAITRHGGDRRAAAAELGMRPNALAMVLKFAHRHQPTEATA